MTRHAALVALVALAGCRAPARPAPVHAPPVAPRVVTAETVFGDASNVADVQTATAVEAVRLIGLEFMYQGLLDGWSEPQTRGERPDFGPQYRDAELGPVVALAPDDAAALRSLLTATATYVSPDGDCACLFVPTVLVRFWIAETPIDVLIGFDCVKLAAFRSGRPLAAGTRFDAGFEALLQVVRRVFPDDEALRLAAERPR